jgi:flagellar motor switch protein FliM
MYEGFARRLGMVLTSTLRRTCTVALIVVEQMTYDEYVGGLSVPTAMATFTLAPLPGTGVFEVPVNAAMICVDCMLGGLGSAEQPLRTLTEIEVSLVRGVVERSLTQLHAAGESLGVPMPLVTAVEQNPPFVRACPPGDPVVVASFELKIESVESVATLCLPLASMMPALDRVTREASLSPAELAAQRAAAKELAGGLAAVPVDVSFRFRTMPVHPEQVVALNIGDVLRLRHPITVPLTVFAGDREMARAVPGTNGPKLACLVVDSAEEEQS